MWAHTYSFPISAKIIDELPIQFQKRDHEFNHQLSAHNDLSFNYQLHPVTRGEYHFGRLLCLTFSPLKLIAKRHTVDTDYTAAVYPSFLQLKKYEFLAINNRLSQIGIKQIRKRGQSNEFDQIREYVRGDDVRTINWKATARRGSLMTNQYQDEKSQNVYCIVDKGRAMKMPFNEMALMDYAINSTLVMSNIAIRKDDRAGLITFSNKMGAFLKATNRRTQIFTIQETLYNQKTRFQESDFGRLYRNIKAKIHTRSLLLLFTNFESLTALQRQLKYLRAIAKNHVLVVVFFENNELVNLINEDIKDSDDVFIQTTAEKFAHEKRQIIKELAKYGIHSILTAPEDLTVHTINTYLNIKARGVI